VKCVYTHEAVVDLERIRIFLIEHYSESYSSIIEELIERVAKLEEFPRLGSRLVSSPIALELREIVIGSYVVRYLILDQTVSILRVWYGKEDRSGIES